MNNICSTIKIIVFVVLAAFMFSSCSSPMERDAKRMAKRVIEFEQLQRRFEDRSNLFGKPISRQEIEQETKEFIEFANQMYDKYSESVENRQEFNEMVEKEIKKLNNGSDLRKSFNPLSGLSVQDLSTSNDNSMQKDVKGYVDLGLRSGTLWKITNENGLYDFDDAKARFGNNLPTKKQVEELIHECDWQDKGYGYRIVGPNGNSLFIKNNGFYDCEGAYCNSDGVQLWTSSKDDTFWVWCLSCSPDELTVTDVGMCCKLAVRLVKNK